MMYPIDRDSPIPAYFQIQMALKERIARGEWAQTKRLPSEGDLANEYSVSRITLRQALAELEKDGLIKKSRGKGATICDNPTPFIHKLDYSLVNAGSTEPGPQVAAEMLSLQRFDCPIAEVAERLELGDSAPIVYLKRLFTLDSKPLAIGRSWLSLDRFPGLDEKGLSNNRLSSTLLNRYQVRAVRVDDYIETVRPTSSECQLLDVAYDCPMLLVRGVSYDESNCPIEYSSTIWLGDMVRFRIALRAGKQGFHVTM